MNWILTRAGIWLILLPLFPQLLSSQQRQTLELLDFVIPSYPRMARLIGKEGVVNAQISLDEACRISQVQVKGEALFISTVKDAVQHWQFSGCTLAQQSVPVQFTFRLDGVSNDWSPTFFEMTKPYEFTITTTRREWQFG